MSSRKPVSVSGASERPAAAGSGRSTRPPKRGVGTLWADATFAEAAPRTRDNAPAAQAWESLDILQNMTDSFVVGSRLRGWPAPCRPDSPYHRCRSRVVRTAGGGLT